MCTLQLRSLCRPVYFTVAVMHGVTNVLYSCRPICIYKCTLHRTCLHVAGVLLRHIGQLCAVAARHRSGPCDAGQCLLPRAGPAVRPHGLHHPLHGLRRQLRRVCECPRRALVRLHPAHILHQGRYYGDRQAKPEIGEVSGAGNVCVSDRHCCGFNGNTQTSKNRNKGLIQWYAQVVVIILLHHTLVQSFKSILFCERPMFLFLVTVAACLMVILKLLKVKIKALSNDTYP